MKSTSQRRFSECEDTESKLKTADRLTALLDPDAVLREVAYIAFSDITELFDERGHLRALDELPDHVVATIASIKIVRRKRSAEQHAVVVQGRGSMPDGDIQSARHKDVEADRTTMTDG